MLHVPKYYVPVEAHGEQGQQERPAFVWDVVVENTVHMARPLPLGGALEERALTILRMS
jgi:hypothetical protein